MALSTLEKVLFLKSIYLFDQIPGEQLVKVAQIAHEVEFEPNEVIIKQGEQGDCLYIIVEGEAEIALNGTGMVRQMQPKSIIGEMAILSGQPRSANCIAQSHLMALKINRNDFWLLMEARSEIALGIIKVLVHNLEVINQRLQSQPAPTDVVPPAGVPTARVGKLGVAAAPVPPPLLASTSIQTPTPASTPPEAPTLQSDSVPLLPSVTEGLKTLTISTYTTDNPGQPETARLKIRTHVSPTGDIDLYLPESFTFEDERYLELHQTLVKEALKTRLAHLRFNIELLKK